MLPRGHLPLRFITVEPPARIVPKIKTKSVHAHVGKKAMEWVFEEASLGVIVATCLCGIVYGLCSRSGS
jgi:hypothetical protein